MSDIIKKQSVPTLTKIQNQIFEYRRKNISVPVILKSLNLTLEEYQNEVESIKKYNGEVVSHYDSDSYIAETFANFDEGEAIVWSRIAKANLNKATNPLDLIKMVREALSIRKDALRLRQELGLVTTKTTAKKRSDFTNNILIQYQGKEQAKQHIKGIVDTTLTSELAEPEPLPDDLEIIVNKS